MIQNFSIWIFYLLCPSFQCLAVKTSSSSWHFAVVLSVGFGKKTLVCKLMLFAGGPWHEQVCIPISDRQPILKPWALILTAFMLLFYKILKLATGLCFHLITRAAVTTSATQIGLKSLTCSRIYPKGLTWWWSQRSVHVSQVPPHQLSAWTTLCLQGPRHDETGNGLYTKPPWSWQHTSD